MGALLAATTLPLDRRFRRERTFDRVFEHFAANLLLWGAFALLFDSETRWIGTLLMLVIAAGVITWGFARRAEAFVLYGFVYAVIAIDVLAIDWIDDGTVALFCVAVSMILAIVGLVFLHGTFRRQVDAA